MIGKMLAALLGAVVAGLCFTSVYIEILRNELLWALLFVFLGWLNASVAVQMLRKIRSA